MHLLRHFRHQRGDGARDQETVKTLGNYFKKKRIEAKLSQNDVAKILKFGSGQFVSNWERGKCLPPIWSLRVIAEIFKIERDELIELILEHTRQAILAEWNKKK